MSDSLNLPPSDTFFADRFARRLFRRWQFVALTAFSVLLLTLFLLYFFSWKAPAQFPSEMLLAVPSGATLGEVGKMLRETELIRSAFWFKAWSVMLGGSRPLKAGEYRFSEPLSTPFLAWRMTHNGFGLTAIRITIPEGSNNTQIAKLLKTALPQIDEGRFLALARESEGYLFPDTYLFPHGATEEDIIKTMRGTFEKRIEAIRSDAEAYGKPLRDVVIMASLIEEETRTEESRRKVADILWKRLALGMPLQVDAVFPYIFGGKPFDLTDGDLNVDSPYNTYKYTGLPPAPITNPGLDAIRAAVTPLETPYLYYLSDREGEMHYAVNHDEHLQNRVKYLEIR